MKKVAIGLIGSMALVVMLFFTLGLAASARSATAQKMKMAENGNTVYVCSCMKTKSCPCMTEAKMEGKCACGAKAPDMKAVPRDSAWARHNREVLASPSQMKM
jgi:hypothetical protein